MVAKRNRRWWQRAACHTIFTAKLTKRKGQCADAADVVFKLGFDNTNSFCFDMVIVFSMCMCVCVYCIYVEIDPYHVCTVFIYIIYKCPVERMEWERIRKVHFLLLMHSSGYLVWTLWQAKAKHLDIFTLAVIKSVPLSWLCCGLCYFFLSSRHALAFVALTVYEMFV